MRACVRACDRIFYFVDMSIVYPRIYLLMCGLSIPNNVRLKNPVLLEELPIFASDVCIARYLSYIPFCSTEFIIKRIGNLCPKLQLQTISKIEQISFKNINLDSN